MDAAELAPLRLAEVRAEAERTRAAGAPLRLVTVLVGDDPGSAMYVSMKQDEAKQLGLDSEDVRLPADTTQAALEGLLVELSERDDVDAVLVQYPLPAGLAYMTALRALDPRKDVDGLHPVNLGLLAAGEPAQVPCTPRGIVDLLGFHGVEVTGRRVTIVGRGLTVGRPLSILLSSKGEGANATVTVVHTGSAPDDLEAAVRGADVVVAAAGSPGLVPPDWLGSDQAIVAAGVSFPSGKAVSDFGKGARDRVRAWTPITGAVGPMTRAWLFKNVVRCRALRTA
jgi:methylenetetrahydrofolate dehydrogenase (NADP+)/methenyltetrahydrofolate cyclohydrolase